MKRYRRSLEGLFLAAIFVVSICSAAQVNAAEWISLDPNLFSTSIKVESGPVYSEILFASNSNDSLDGNWIELSNGTPLNIPKLVLNYPENRNETFAMEGANVTIISTSSAKKLVYPFTAFHVAVMGEDLTATYHGSKDFAGLDVSFTLVNVKTESLGSAISGALDGDLSRLTQFLNNPVKSIQKTLDSNGDATVDFFFIKPDTYTLFVIGEKKTTTSQSIWILGGTVVEVVDYPIYIAVSPKIPVGSEFRVDLYTKSPAANERFVYGVMVMKPTAYNVDFEFTSYIGLLPEENLSINGLAFSKEIIDVLKGELGGTGGAFNKALLIDAVTKFFGSGVVSIGFSDPLSTNHCIIDLKVGKDLPKGDYLLTVGIWETSTGRQVAAVKQTTISLIDPPPVVTHGTGTGTNNTNTGSNPPPKVEQNWTFLAVDLVLLIALVIVVIRPKRG